MQRNNHLELELKRATQHLNQLDSLHIKYKDVKIDYKQLLQSFERSEEIRREQKELIGDHKKQLRVYKAKHRRQDQKIKELMREVQTLKGQQNGLQNDSHLSAKALA